MSGDGVVAHNRRTYFAENVDPTRTHLNAEYCYTPIEEAYHQLFDAALAEFNAKQKRKEELAELEQSIERVQQQQVSIQAVEQIEAKPLPLTSKVAVDREDYQNLVTAAQKYIAQEKQEGKLKKLLKEAKKTISDLKAKIQSLTAELSAVKAELAQYKSVRGKLRTADLEQENSCLRSKIRSYESAIERNDLWHIFNPHRNKTHNRDDAR